MSISNKKMEMASKMYKQNSPGGKGTSPKNYQNGKETKSNSKGENFKMVGKGKGKEQERTPMSNGKGKFEAKYEQADNSGSIKGGYKMANC